MGHLHPNTKSHRTHSNTWTCFRPQVWPCCHLHLWLNCSTLRSASRRAAVTAVAAAAPSGTIIIIWSASIMFLENDEIERNEDRGDDEHQGPQYAQQQVFTFRLFSRRCIDRSLIPKVFSLAQGSNGYLLAIESTFVWVIAVCASERGLAGTVSLPRHNWGHKSKSCHHRRLRHRQPKSDAMMLWSHGGVQYHRRTTLHRGSGVGVGRLLEVNCLQVSRQGLD